jgi:hypothetical protein
MPDPVNRKSLESNIEKLYNTTKVGGAFDAKTVGKVFVDTMNNDFADGFTRGGANTNFPKKESMYVKGLDTTKYK